MPTLHDRLKELPRPWIIPLQEYLDENPDDRDSIASNNINGDNYLQFRNALIDLTQDPKTEATYVLVTEVVDMASDQKQLYVDTLFVVTTMGPAELARIVYRDLLCPDVFRLFKPPTDIPILKAWLEKPVLVYEIWWD